MKRFVKKHRDLLYVLVILFAYRIYLVLLVMNQGWIPVRNGFLGLLRDANFDGGYYLFISQYGYHGLDQAFFPLFPLAIKAFTIVGLNVISAAVLVTVLSLFAFLYTFCKLIKIDYKGTVYMWVLLFSLAFPTSFFFASIYTESLFLFLTVLSFYFARKEKIFLASVCAALASATRLIGIFLLPALMWELWEQQKKKGKIHKKRFLPLLLIPVGLLSYMSFLWVRYADPLLFVHQQPLFGAERSGGGVVLLPQVIYRYIKIFITLPPNSLTFWISMAEFTTFFLGIALLVLAYRKKVRKSYIIFSLCALLFPPLSGTFSSLPRYALVAFVIFIYLGTIPNRYVKVLLLSVGLILETVFGVLFLQGYFVS